MGSGALGSGVADALPAVESVATRFARLWGDHGAALQRLAACYEWNAEERRDLVQEICLAIWRALPGFRGGCSERTFVFRIGHNRGLTHRWRRRRPTVDLASAADVPDPAPAPDEQANTGERQQRLLAAVRRLPETHRQVVALSLEGLTTREIAEVLGTSENAIAIRLTRARKALRELLSGRTASDEESGT
jgi:RNA polymerase sigma-70 factor (ECF subfamily)